MSKSRILIEEPIIDKIQVNQDESYNPINVIIVLKEEKLAITDKNNGQEVSVNYDQDDFDAAYDDIHIGPVKITMQSIIANDTIKRKLIYEQTQYNPSTDILQDILTTGYYNKILNSPLSIDLILPSESEMTKKLNVYSQEYKTFKEDPEKLARLSDNLSDKFLKIDAEYYSTKKEVPKESPERMNSINKKLSYLDMNSKDPVSLSIEDLSYLNSYYQTKHNIKIIQNSNDTIKDSIEASAKAAKLEINNIQNNLQQNEVVGYVFTNGQNGGQSHIDFVLITQDAIIQPIVWPDATSHSFKFQQNNAAGTTFVNGELLTSYWLKNTTTYPTLHPQASRVGCGALSYSYLKELLKDDAKQLKENCLIVPYYLDDKLNYFFIPSPQVLTYSQSSSYNNFIRMIMSPGNEASFDHNNTVKTLQASLEETLFIAKNNNNEALIKTISVLQQKLPDFQTKWIEEYDKMLKERELMTTNKTIDTRLRQVRLQTKSRFFQEKIREQKNIEKNSDTIQAINISHKKQ